MSGDPVRSAAAANAQDSTRARGSAVVFDGISQAAGTTASTAPPSSRPAAANAGGGNRECLAPRITPCPQFDRLRAAAREDRLARAYLQLQEVKRTAELCERQTLLSQRVTMHEYYATLFRPSRAGAAAAARTPTFASSSPAGTLRPRDVVLNDLEESFIACYYRMHPAALQRKREAEAAEAQRRQSAQVAAQLSSFSGALPRSRSLTAQRGPKSTGKKKSKGKGEEKPKEGAPAANLRLLLAALLEASDDRGLITCDALAVVLKRPPFDVHDAEAVEAFFYLVRAASTVTETGESETDRRLEASTSASTLAPRVRRRSTSLRVSAAMVTGTPGGMGLSTPLTSTGTLPTSLRRLAQGSGASQSLQRRAIPTSRASKAAAASVTALGGGPAAATEPPPPSMVRAREVLAAMDAVINGPELRDVVRSLCFDVLESDGFIHKTTLRTLRLVRREACEAKDAAATPSIVKALGDALEVMLQEEEDEYLRSQAKGKRRAKAAKAAALPPHQKSAVPLHMMRRSHINLKQFSRFFDELPMVAAAFAHVWFPAFFSTNWPPVKRPMSTGFNDDAAPDEDDENNTNNAGEGTSEESGLRRRNAARRVVTERLEYMKPVSVPASEGTSQR
ncbi:uncharacterized protein Tco025E_03694 [Trypanosoma conorhini]|uniref:Uncharacterized protein n=1 Tax=Trypanosoma conorhini TaxID=83891 RepID=A0A3R7PIY3_9TRYP|nr:uncharacterized protein Tco025E_03694 [Trypanosoma conorhini]RNF20667.1 hypothetical protein Tco025E_03694 [Trypanosoma conorhini]